METITYTVKPSAGPLLSHVQAMYWPGERQIAIGLFEALGCAVYDLGSKGDGRDTTLAVHPDPGERSPDNVIFLTDMPERQLQLEAALRQAMEADDDLRATRDRYAEAASERPFSLSHIAVRYPTFEALEQVLAGFEARLPADLKPRAHLKVFRPGERGAGRGGQFQAFLYTDVVTAGLSPFGQIFELGAFL